MSKQYFNAFMTCRGLWVRVLHRVASLNYLAPHSFPMDHMETREIIQNATRLDRIAYQLHSNESSDDINPLHFRCPDPSRFKLSFDAPGKRLYANDFQLLPGGRWIVGSVIVGSEKQLLCWDRLSLNKHDPTIPPAAKISGLANATRNINRRSIPMQYDARDRSVNFVMYYRSSDSL